MTKTSTTKANPMTSLQDGMAAFNPMQGAGMKAMLAVGTETAQFLSSRMQQDIEAQKAMLSCKDLESLQKLQADFYTKALADYRDATAKIMEIMSATASDAGAAAVSSTKRSYDDVPL
ncbi:phasin family protein [Pseudorhodobacter sp. W20_MBD10_FR17]|uniref:phasin family protein n=1 Tax=Pseudorhodobacter sp. W20_MBD10_FR17 TaxID=3240266 RepID=UPI003F98FA5E